jgi:mannose-6-phosphate isomerase-like protein (cupin superfamily)
LDAKPVRSEISFSEEKMKKNSLFDSPYLFYDAYCLLPGQGQKLHAHEGSDKIYYVLEGTGRFTVGDEEEDLGEGHAVIARAGVPHGVSNATDENLVLLVTMAPRPS